MPKEPVLSMPKGKTVTLEVRQRTPHLKQEGFIDSSAKRRVVRAGRRSGKTTGVAILAINKFLAGHRVLYAAPRNEQTDKFWREIKRALAIPIKAGIYYKNETRRFIEVPNTENSIRAKTAWDADSMRGDYADWMVYEEFQDMKPEAWTKVGAPMLLDNDGTAIFIYTGKRGSAGLYPRTLFKRAEKLEKEALERGEAPRWEVFKFTSHDNPHISEVALDEISEDMTHIDYQLEIMAEDLDEDPDALWTRDMIEDHRVRECPDLHRVVVAVDPPSKATGAECGIVVGGAARRGQLDHAYILSDVSKRGRPDQWGKRVLISYYSHLAGRIIGEVNNGGDMVEHTIRTVTLADGKSGASVPFKQIRASRGKMTRAEPVANLYAEGRVHHVGGGFSQLEDQLSNWIPGQNSPDRLDALVYCVTELLLGSRGWSRPPAG